MRRPPCHLRVLTLVLLGVACLFSQHVNADGEVFLTEFRIEPAGEAGTAWRAAVVSLLQEISDAVSLSNVTFVLSSP